MKKRLIPIACALTVGLLSARSQSLSTESVTDVAADAFVVRPVAFVGTVIGSVVFVVTLPFTAPSCGVRTAAHALVVVPAHYTFTRPLGELETWDVDAF